MAYSVARLAERWQCSTGQIYKLIRDKKLQTFAIGKRGLRISDEEVLRCEGGGDAKKAIGTETSASGGEKTEKPLPTSAMKALASAGG